MQQALAAMQDKPKQVVPLPSKRASVARPVSAAPAEAEHEDMEDEDSELEDEHEVSCDWWRAGHVTTTLTLIGPGDAERGRGAAPLRDPQPRARAERHQQRGQPRQQPPHPCARPATAPEQQQ